jgi:hypothetical protein
VALRLSPWVPKRTLKMPSRNSMAKPLKAGR